MLVYIDKTADIHDPGAHQSPALHPSAAGQGPQTVFKARVEVEDEEGKVHFDMQICLSPGDFHFRPQRHH